MKYLLPVLVILSLMVAGCSDGGDTSDPSPTLTPVVTVTPTPTQEPTAIVESVPTEDRCYWGRSPEVVFDVTVMTPVEEEPIVVQFTDQSKALNWGDDVRAISSWAWDFGDGTSSADQNPQHTYSRQGIYNVSLLVRDSEDCKVSAQQNLYLTPPTGALVSFPDPNLQLLIRYHLMMPKGDIYESHLEHIVHLRDRLPNDDTLVALPLADLTGLQYCKNLKSLVFEYAEITDISVLETLTSLESINLSENKISDISPLASLTNLTKLWLGDNQISDISPLVENNGIGVGDEVDLTGNPLNETSINVYIPQLEERGVKVIWE